MSPNVRAFYDALQKQGPITHPLSSYGYEYDPIMLALAAMKKTDSTDSVKVAGALEQLGTVASAVMQPVYFTPQSHFPEAETSATVFMTPGQLVNGMFKPKA
jgi:ABC-type branched-subunit amino acid transport system substrate-binding protein